MMASNYLVSSILQAAMEQLAATEALDGKTAVEREKVFYCQIADFAELEKADSWEKQEQWEIRPKETNAGVVRVRRTSAGEISLATKVFDGDVRQETEIEISEDIFNGFRSIAPGGMIKTRYNFKIPNTEFKWEIDVYNNADGSPCEWCKVDLECDSLDMENPPFPITFTKVISGNRAAITPEERSFIETLFSTKFITRNPKAGNASMESIQLMISAAIRK